MSFIRDLHIEYFYMSHGRLIPYDFRNQEHTIKFEITCSTDKLEGLPKVPLENVADEPKISIPEIVEDTYPWKEYLSIGGIILLGFILMVIMRRKPKLT